MDVIIQSGHQPIHCSPEPRRTVKLMNKAFTKIFSCAYLMAFLSLGVTTEAETKTPGGVASCIACHGKEGFSNDSNIPTIAGASEFFLENQLFLFQEKSRPCVADLFSKIEVKHEAADHCTLLAGLSKNDITATAAYFAALPHQSAEQVPDEALAKIGEEIHKRACDRCHANGGSLALDDAGILAGQWRPYLIRTMTDFREGRRWQDKKMEQEMKALSDEQIRALAEYYVSQGQ